MGQCFGVVAEELVAATKAFVEDVLALTGGHEAADFKPIEELVRLGVRGAHVAAAHNEHAQGGGGNVHAERGY